MADMPPIASEDDPAPDAGKAPRKAPGRPWQPGQSGNPAGYRKGSRHKASLLAETLLDGEADRITRRCIEMAIDGEPVAMRLAVERLLPPRKSRPLAFRLGVLHTADDAKAALSQIIAASASGEILLDEAQVLSGIVHNFLRAIETAEIEARLCALEQANAEARAGVSYNA
jgi:hypothetical protein